MPHRAVNRRWRILLHSPFFDIVKYSSIVSILSIQELTFQGLQIMASTNVTFEKWLTISVMYLVLCFTLSQA